MNPMSDLTSSIVSHASDVVACLDIMNEHNGTRLHAQMATPTTCEVRDPDALGAKSVRRKTTERLGCVFVGGGP